jgi:hypothetical protein
VTAATPAVCGHEHEYGGIAYRCERPPHPVDGHEERHRHAARIDAGYAREIGDVDGQGTPDLLTWEGDEPGDGDNTEVAWGSVASYGGAPGSSHIGRSWSGHGIEDDCPCPKAPCGLVVQETVAETCDQHPLSARRTIRQSHRADECPAAQPQPARELAGATAETRRYRAALAQIASMAEARGAVRSVSNIARIARKALEGQ